MKLGIAYFHTRDPRHAAKDLDEIVACGCNFIVLTFSELDLAYYNASTAEIIRMCKDRDLEVYINPWALGCVYGGEAFSRFIADNPDVRQVRRDGFAVTAACFNQPKFREFQNQWVKRAGEIGGDICFWDEPHFFFDWQKPETWENWACRCEVCCDLYRQESGEEMPREYTDEVVAFRQRTAVRFLDVNCKEAKRNGMRNCVLVLPEEGEGVGKAAGLSAWEELIALESVDIFGTDPYWCIFDGKLPEYVTRHCQRIMELGERYGKEVQAWVQAFSIPEGREEEVRIAAETIYESGIRNIAAWGFRACEFIDIRCDRPELVWQILVESFNKFNRRSHDFDSGLSKVLHR